MYYQINDKKLEWIIPVLKEWNNIHKTYVEEFDFKDSLYWFNERANVGALAGAIWKSGGFALEEYSTKKGAGTNKKNGRVDLFFSFNKNEVIVEAKMKWLYLSDKSRLSYQDVVNKISSKAKSDIENSLRANNYPLGFGITFITPYWNHAYNAKEKMAVLRKFMESYDCDFYAIFENTSGNDIVSSKGNVCNSVILIGTAHYQCVNGYKALKRNKKQLVMFCSSTIFVRLARRYAFK